MELDRVVKVKLSISFSEFIHETTFSFQFFSPELLSILIFWGYTLKRVRKTVAEARKAFLQSSFSEAIR